MGGGKKKNPNQLSERDYKKAVGRSKSKSESAQSPKEDSAQPQNCCAVPLPRPGKTMCSIGAKIDPKNVPDGAELFLCSNAQRCAVNKWVHRECIEQLEDELVNVMSHMTNSRCGSQHSWTDAQRRMNIWNKKGYDAIFKFCRCFCGGFLKRDVDGTVAVATKQLPKEPTAAKVNAKLKKDSLLPKLASAKPVNNSTTYAASYPADKDKQCSGSVEAQKKKVMDMQYDEDDNDMASEYSYSYSHSASSNTFSAYLDSAKSERRPRSRHNSGPTHFWNDQPVNDDTEMSVIGGRKVKAKAASNFDPLQVIIPDSDRIRDEDTLKEKVRSLLAASDGRLMWDDASLLRIDVLLHGALKRTVSKMGGIRDWLFQHCPPHWCADYYPKSPMPSPPQANTDPVPVSAAPAVAVPVQAHTMHGDVHKRINTNTSSVCSAASMTSSSNRNSTIGQQKTEPAGVPVAAKPVAVAPSSLKTQTVSSVLPAENEWLGAHTQSAGRTDSPSTNSTSGQSSLVYTPDIDSKTSDMVSDVTSQPYVSASSTGHVTESPQLARPPGLVSPNPQTLVAAARYGFEGEEVIGWMGRPSIYEQHGLQLQTILARLQAMQP